VDLEDLEAKIRRFAAEREWDQFHSVRNLLFALVGEVGEVTELLQWIDDSEVGGWLNGGGRERLGEELADVLIYLVRLADKAGIDLSNAVSTKLEMNEAKYPVRLAKGNAQKYTELA